MVCAKCAKASKPTSLATPGVKSKKDMYYGSAAGNKTGASKAGTSSATIGQTGIGKSKLLSASAKNPYAAYGGTCTGKECVAKIEKGRKYCTRCAYREQRCAICGKKEKKDGAGSASGVPKVDGMKFTMK